MSQLYEPTIGSNHDSRKSKPSNATNPQDKNSKPILVEYAESLKSLKRRYCQLRAHELKEDGLDAENAGRLAYEESKGILAFFDKNRGVIVASDFKHLRQKEKENSKNNPEAFNPDLRLIYGSVLKFETIRAKTGDEHQALKAQLLYLINNGLFVNLTSDGISIHRKGGNLTFNTSVDNLDCRINSYLSASPLCSQSVTFIGDSNSTIKTGFDWNHATIHYSATKHTLAPQPNYNTKKGITGYKRLLSLCGDVIKVGPSQDPFEVSLAEIRFSHDEVNVKFGHNGESRPSIWMLVNQLRADPNYYLKVPPLRLVQIAPNDYISLDNRRLACLILANCPKALVKWATKKDINEELLWRFTSENEGLWARIRGTETDIIVPR